MRGRDLAELRSIFTGKCGPYGEFCIKCGCYCNCGAIFYRPAGLEISGFRKTGQQFFIGFVVAIIGIAMISFNGASFKMSPFGDLLALLAALSWAIYSILTRKLAAPGREASQPPGPYSSGALSSCCPLFLYEGINLEAEKLSSLSMRSTCFFLGLLASALCFAAWTFSLKSLGAVKLRPTFILCPL